MWYGNPRHIHLKNHIVYKMGIAKIETFGTFCISKNLYNYSDGIIMTETGIKDNLDIIAKEDGFYSVEEYLQKLGLINKLTISQVEARTWATIKWFWLEGPYTYSQYNLLKTKEGANWTN
jgi:hypothetical protein